MNLPRPRSGPWTRNRSRIAPPPNAAAPGLSGLIGAAAARLRRLRIAARLPRAAAAPLAAAALALPLWQLELEALAVMSLALGAGLAAWFWRRPFRPPTRSRWRIALTAPTRSKICWPAR